MGAAGLPATWQLGVALAWGFLLFNQLLFAAMDLLYLSKNDPDTAGKFAIASLAAGGFVAIANVVFFAISTPKSLTDWQVIAVSLASSFVLGVRLGGFLGDSLVVGFLLANLFVGIWLARGLFRKPASKKSQKF